MKKPSRPPRDDLFRAHGAFVIAPTTRADGDETAPAAEPVDDNGTTLSGHFAVFNVDTEIHSYWEGDFIERIAPGAFKKTFAEQRDQMRILLQHGYDPQLGDKPIATITELREDETGAYYEAELLDGLDPLVVSGLRAGVYGASFRFRVMREEYVEEPGVSDDNPQGLPVRTIKEVQVREFGPVTWGQYPEATAGVRSLTDRFVVERLAQDPDRLERLMDERDAQIVADQERAALLVAEDAPADDETSPAAADAPEAEAERAEDTQETQDPAPADDESVRRDQEQDPTEAPAHEATPKADPIYSLKTGKRKPAWLLGK